MHKTYLTNLSTLLSLIIISVFTKKVGIPWMLKLMSGNTVLEIMILSLIIISVFMKKVETSWMLKKMSDPTIDLLIISAGPTLFKKYSQF